jgi:hypothetical protein
VRAISKSLGSTVHVYCCFSLIKGSSHSKAKSYWESWCKAIVKKASFKSKTVTDLLSSGIGIGWYMDQSLEDEWESQLCLPITDLVSSYILLLVLLQVKIGCYREPGKVLTVHVLETF